MTHALAALAGFVSGTVVTALIAGNQIAKINRMMEVIRHECGAPDPDTK